MKKLILFFCISLFLQLYFVSAANAEWSFGIGTGYSINNVEGKIGFDTELLGPIEHDLSLDQEDLQDYMKTAFGFGGYVSNGFLLCRYQFIYRELEGGDSEYIPAYTSTVETDIDFKIYNAEATIGLPVFKSQYLLLILDAGARYTKHSFDGSLTSTGGVNQTFRKKFSYDWTDPLLGISFNIPIAQQLSLNCRFNAGYFGSDGTYLTSAALMWKFHKNVSAGLTGKYVKVKYEKSEQGDEDWYYYKVNESSAGINFMLHF